jgi:hypothetical protein
MKRLQLVLSFDHELSLGGAESYRHNLFDPTDELMALAQGLGVPIALFTDVCCAIRYRDWDREGFFDPYCEQIGRALVNGHDVQLHIHPHWMDSNFVNGEYRPSTSFALGDFAAGSPPNDISGIVGRSYDFLSELCLGRDANYLCVAYRAGGNNLAPYTETILQNLYDKGVRIDSSIVKGFRFRSGISTVDFSGMPRAANWTIPLSGPLNAEAASGIYEVPIAGRPRTPLNNAPFLINRVIHAGRAHDPRGRSIHAANTPLPQKLARLFPRSAWPLGFDDAAQSVEDIARTLRAHVEAHQEDEIIVCAAVSHPKCMGNYERSLMRGFVERARSEYGSALEFTTYRSIYDRLPML